jgi:hypothetical protein
MGSVHQAGPPGDPPGGRAAAHARVALGLAQVTAATAALAFLVWTGAGALTPGATLAAACLAALSKALFWDTQA